MKYEEVFKETLKSLAINSIYIDGFDAEQIFFQLDNVTNRLIDSLEENTNREHSKFLMENKSAATTANDVARLSSNLHSGKATSDLSSDADEFEDSVTDKGTGDVDDSSKEENAATDTCIESLGPSESLDSELNYHSEETVSFDADMWVDSCSSDMELINEPAHEVLRMLRGRKHRKEGTKTNKD